MSNCYCLPGRAGGSPNVLVSLLSRCRGRRIVAPATNDTQALSAVTAVAHFGQNREILILSHGGVAPARQELRRKGSSLWGTIAHFPESFGDRVLPAALQILAGHKVPSNHVLRHAVLTQKNVSQHYPGCACELSVVRAYTIGHANRKTLTEVFGDRLLPPVFAACRCRMPARSLDGQLTALAGCREIRK